MKNETKSQSNENILFHNYDLTYCDIGGFLFPIVSTRFLKEKNMANLDTFF